MKFKLNKNKRIGQVLFVVEGLKTEQPKANKPVTGLTTIWCYKCSETVSIYIVLWYNINMKDTKNYKSNAETITISRAEYDELKLQNQWLME